MAAIDAAVAMEIESAGELSLAISSNQYASIATRTDDRPETTRATANHAALESLNLNLCVTRAALESQDALAADADIGVLAVDLAIGDVDGNMPRLGTAEPLRNLGGLFQPGENVGA